ncbi:MAG: three-Cys-motif partner protein TcmP [Ilumatobacteraceae bacterium]
MAREWGFWTRDKLEILSAYLPAFTTASKRARGTVYLDLYAGTLENTERDTGELILGSASRALDTSPAFTRCYFFELATVATKLRADLKARYPDRGNYEVIEGDSNETLAIAFESLRKRGLGHAATFAFIDPYNLGIRWSTLEVLGRFKANDRFKVEFWILIFSSAIPRVLGGEGDENLSAEQVTEFFGTDQWTAISEARACGALSPPCAREEYVNLYRWRIENELGYAFTHVFEMKNTNGSPLYHLILATDNKAGEKIIADVYRKATPKHEATRRKAHERRRIGRKKTKGQDSLFSAEQLVATGPAIEVVYNHQPPWPPFGTV